MATSHLPYVISLNCLEQFTGEMSSALADLCVFESVGLVEGMLDKIPQASIVVLPSIQYLPRAAQRKLSPTQLLLCLGAGADMRAVETSVAEELGLRLIHVDIPRSDEVADTVMALMLGLLRKSHNLAAQGCTSASWHGGFRDAWAGMRRLKGLTLGLVGVNAVGRAVARRAAAFGMNILYCDLESDLLGADVAEAKRKGKIRKALQGVGKGMMTLRQTVQQSDVVSLHCSLKDDTLHMINDKSISYFKKGSVLVNTSSCHLVSDSALKRALQSGLLSCCALDGVEGPQWMEAWVREFPNVLILPRSADQSTEAWAELSQKALYVLRSFLTQGRVPSDAVVVEDIAAEEAAWAAMGLPPPPPVPVPAAVPAAAIPVPKPSTGSTISPVAAAVAAPKAASPAGSTILATSAAARPNPNASTMSSAQAAASAQPNTTSSSIVPTPAAAKAPPESSASSEKPSALPPAPGAPGPASAAAAAGAGASGGGSESAAAAEAVSGVEALSIDVTSIHSGKNTGAAAGKAGASGIPQIGSKDGKVSFGDVQTIQMGAASPAGEEQGYERQGSSSDLTSEGLPLPAGALIALRAKDKAGEYYTVEKSEMSSDAYVLVLKAQEGGGHKSPASQFVVVAEKDVLGLRSVFAQGKFLQATPSGELVFCNADLDSAESWCPVYSPETKLLQLTNINNDKVTLEATVEMLT